DLPGGHQIQGIEVDYDSIAASGDTSVHLEQSDNTGDHTDLITLQIPSGCSAPCAFKANLPASPTVNNDAFHYGVWVNAPTPSGGIGATGFVIYRVGLVIS